MKRLLTAAIALSLLTGTAGGAWPPNPTTVTTMAATASRVTTAITTTMATSGRAKPMRGTYDRHAQHNWARGQRLPAAYYQDRGRYVDYRTYHLHRPPHGYQWVQVDNNYALVALTTGLIASIVAVNH